MRNMESLSPAYVVIITKQSSSVWLMTSSPPYYLFLFTVNTAAAGPGYCITLQTAECRQLARVECGAGCWQQGHGQCSMWRLDGGWSLEPELTLTLQPRPDSGKMILCSLRVENHINLIDYFPVTSKFSILSIKSCHSIILIRLYFSKLIKLGKPSQTPFLRPQSPISYLKQSVEFEHRF